MTTTTTSTTPEAVPEAINVRWDLSAFYAGLDDARLDADIREFERLAEQFSDSYRGKIAGAPSGAIPSAATFSAAIRDYAEIEMLGGKITTYLSLLESADLTNAAIKAKHSDTEQKLSRLEGEYLTFFELELAQIDEASLREWYENDGYVAKHRPWIEHVRLFKPHFLSEPVEAALTKRSPFSTGSWSEFFDEVEADLEFHFRGAAMTVTGLLHILGDSKDASERAEAMACLNAGLDGAFAKYSAQTLYVVAGAKALEDRERGYLHPMDRRNKINRIPDSAVESLHRAVTGLGGSLARRYYKLKASHLGLPVLRWSDRNAPMPFADTTVVPFAEARQIVTEAYGSASPTLELLVKGMFADRRIDAPALKEKRHGAFNSSQVLPGGKPISYTLLNYLGSNSDVMTLAHELGHGVHGLLAGEAQGPLMSHAPIAYCETASIFGEMITFNFIKQRLARLGEKKSLLAVIMAKIDGMINTVVRQIGFSNVERRVHGIDPTYTRWDPPRRLSVEELDAIWLTTVQELYGKSGDVFTFEDTSHLWCYVPHFHSPFYVYGYAFGELLTQSLLAQRERLGAKFEPLYLELLCSGSTRDLTSLLAPFGLDPGSEVFWQQGIALGLGALIEEAETLSREMGAAKPQLAI